MKKPEFRRNFIKRSMLAIAGFFGIQTRVFPRTKESDHSSASVDEDLPNDTLKTIHDLRTTHGNFSDKEISNNEIEIIKKACIRAANSSNMQTYSIILIRDKELMREVCGYVGSCLMLFNVDYNRLISSAKVLALDYYPDNMTNFITASINTSIATQTATIAARSLGIDSLLTNGIHRGDMERQWKLLGLPEKSCFPLIALVLGYADRKPEYMMGRLDGKSIFHDTKYHTLTKEDLDKITQKYDDPNIHLGLNQNYKDNGYDHYQEWLYKEWLSGNSKPTTEETQIFTQLRKRNFMDI
jgi:nitroreductase